jgi:hypothetical protein
MAFNYLFSVLVFVGFVSCSSKEKGESNEKVLKPASGTSFEIFVKGLQVPWSIVFSSGSRVWLTKGPGALE